MTSKNFLIFILILEVVFTGRIALAKSRKVDKVSVTIDSGEAKVVSTVLEQFGTRPLKTSMVFWRITRSMSENDQKYFLSMLENKNAGVTPVTLVKLTPTKLQVKWGKQKATLELVSVSDRTFKINEIPIVLDRNSTPADIQAKIDSVLFKKTASIRSVIFDLLIPSAHAQDLSFLGPLLQLFMQQMQQSAQASADCSAINQMLQYCNSVTHSAEDPQRVSGAGLDSHCITPGKTIVQKQWSAATHSQCGGQLKQLAEAISLAEFEKMYGGFKPCADPHQQGGGFVAVAYTIPCPAAGNAAGSAAGGVTNNQTVVPGAQIRQQPIQRALLRSGVQ